MSSSPPTGPPPSFRASIAMDQSPFYASTLPNAVNTNVYPSPNHHTPSTPSPVGINNNPAAHNRFSLQQQPIGAIRGDALDPLRRFSAAHSPTDSIRSHLNNRNSGQYNAVSVSPSRDSAAAQALQQQEKAEKPPSYSQSKFDPNANRNNNIYSTVMNTSTEISPQQQVGGISLKGTGTVAALNNEEMPQEKIASPRSIQDKSSLSKTICGCFSFVCACPMLTLVCLFSIVEVAAIVLFNSLQTIGYDPTDHANNKTIFIMVIVGQAVTFLAVMLCCAGATLLAVSSMCDNSQSKIDTKNRFVVSMIVIGFTAVFLLLLAVRGGVEGYSTKLIVDKIMPVFQDFSTLKDNIAAAPLMVALAMFGLCVLTILVCGFMAFVCCCWFCCASTCLFAKQRKREKKSKENTETVNPLNNTSLNV
ncbi:hypothetical protein NAEGRDRAFT_58758 [Naegleria gruberi]|uniref:Transmembrane protein n=1 Tax=Naegleria gruberi TaxID=5762 RepID=D2VNI8_NAEGR|nr:uncharacterized protein NAEGRDRAFT_58758 [Naegleria gruberi]EFC41743.1 hypothetical protein NAEGRDRAFT_58758 [Naegleria gruberi]|eukprot:XP_002674487.1 hypothetical protein NAEGRDRAFT_58758 [Naegleria gruberi strain NEG-M]